MKKIFVLTLAVLMLAPAAAHAAGAGEPVPEQHWQFSGMFGQYDKAAMQRGLKVYREVCASCHAMKLVNYRNLTALGYSIDQVKNIAAEYSVMDGPNDEGDMFERTARPSDAFVSPYANDQQAVAVNGALPPDLSLITKARASGPDYLYALLTGYEEGHKNVPAGKAWNKYFSGNIISMANPLSDGMIGYEDGTPETAVQYASDVTNFLTWAADPHMEERKRTGIKVLFFLLAFAGLMYAYKRKIWADVKK